MIMVVLLVNNPTFVLDSYFLNLLNDIIIIAEIDDVELTGIDLINIAVYTLHSIVTSDNDNLRPYYNVDAVKTTLNSVIGDKHFSIEFLDKMKNVIESGDVEKIDNVFANIGATKPIY